MTVYIDIVFLMNFTSALHLLTCAHFFYSLRGRLWRLIVSAVIGGVYGTVALFFSQYRICSGINLVFMVVIAWGKEGIVKNTLRILFLEGAVLVLLLLFSGVLGIKAVALDGSIRLIGTDFICALLLIVIYPVIVIINKIRKRYNNTVSCIFYLNGKEIRLKLLYDSGNLLTHKTLPVAVVDWRKISQVESYDELLTIFPERLLYNTVSSSGIMPVIKPQKAVLGGFSRECYIGLTDRSFKGYDGVIGDIDRGGK